MSHPQSDDDMSESSVPSGFNAFRRVLARLFASCSADPKGSVHRAWGITLIFIIMYSVVAGIEMANLQKMGGAEALVFATIWTGLAHVILAILGTFILKRFPTSFSIGFLLGILIVLSNQNLLLFSTFKSYNFGNPQTNRLFAAAAFSLFAVIGVFSLLLFQFKTDVVVAPADGKGVSNRDSSSNYHSYRESS